MARTPDDFPGERIEDNILFISSSYIPSQNGEMSYVSGSGFKFYEEGVLKGLGGLSEVEHEYLNVLPHDISIGSFDDVLYGVFGLVTMSVWVDSSRTQLLQHYNATYSNRLLATLTSSVYLSGSLHGQLIEEVSYDNKKRITNVIRTRIL